MEIDVRHIFNTRIPASSALSAEQGLDADQLRILHALHADTAARLQDAIHELLPAATVSLVSLEETTFARHAAGQGVAEYAASFSAHSAQAGRLELGDGLSMALLDSLLGYQGALVGETRSLSDIELSLLHSAVDSLLGAYAQAWRDVVPCRFARDNGECPAAGEAIYAATFSVSTHASAGRISILLRLPAWADALGKLPRQTEEPVPSNRNFGLLDAIGDTMLTARAVLGSTRLCIGDFLSLRPGDVICLDQDATAPVEVHVGQKTRLQGQARIQNGKYLITIERTAARGE